jgi:hypothetical protein
MKKENISKIAQDIIRNNYSDEQQEQSAMNEDVKEIIDISKETIPSTPLIKSISLRGGSK